MIRITDLLTEITMGGIQPYATSFTWQQSGKGYETQVPCDDIPVKFSLTWVWSPEGDEYAFAIATPSRFPTGHTMTHGNTTARGQLSYLRVLGTAAESIMDFCTQYSPMAIDVTGYDPSTEKDLQKTRIYRNLLHANQVRIQQAGYNILDQNGKLWLVRTSTADTTGVQ